MIPYTSWPGGLQSRRDLRRAGWAVLTSPQIMAKNGWLPPRWANGDFIEKYALDNGAWNAHTQEKPFDSVGFRKALSIAGEGAEWTVVPDIVAGGLKSLDMSLEWLDEVKEYGQCLLAVQDGIEPHHVKPYLGPDVGIAIGGSTEWKISTARDWGMLAKQTGCYLHMLRVNSKKRIKLCYYIGADSFDGSSVAQFPCTLNFLDYWSRQPFLFSGVEQCDETY